MRRGNRKAPTTVATGTAALIALAACAGEGVAPTVRLPSPPPTQAGPGPTPTAIAMRLCHSLSSIERYLDDFCRVAAILDEDLSTLAVSRITDQSPRLVSEYRALYEEFRADPAYQEALEILQRRIRGLRAGKKRGQ